MARHVYLAKWSTAWPFRANFAHDCRTRRRARLALGGTKAFSLISGTRGPSWRSSLSAIFRAPSRPRAKRIWVTSFGHQARRTQQAASPGPKAVLRPKYARDNRAHRAPARFDFCDGCYLKRTGAGNVFFLHTVLFLLPTPAYACLLICEFVLFRGGHEAGIFHLAPPPLCFNVL